MRAIGRVSPSPGLARGARARLSHRSDPPLKGNSGMKLYVGNLSYGVNDAALRALFEPHGAVESATVVADRESGRSKGFGFVEMSDADAQKAIQALNGSPHQRRTTHGNT